MPDEHFSANSVTPISYEVVEEPDDVAYVEESVEQMTIPGTIVVRKRIQ